MAHRHARLTNIVLIGMPFMLSLGVGLEARKAHNRTAALSSNSDWVDDAAEQNDDKCNEGRWYDPFARYTLAVLARAGAPRLLQE